MKSFELLKQLDAYPRLLESYASGTVVGATVSLISASIITALIVLELLRYSGESVAEELFVDTTRDHKLKINLDIVIPKLSCDYLSIDATDSSGNQDVKVVQHVKKIKLDLLGNEIVENFTEPLILPNNTEDGTGNQTANKCGSCYGAAKRCCNTCEEVIGAYREKRWEPNYDEFEQCKENRLQKKFSEFRAFEEGCHLIGYMEVNRIAGNFHIAPGKSFSVNHIHVHDIQPFSSSHFNLTHIFNHFSFGDKLEIVDTHPLDGTIASATEDTHRQQPLSEKPQPAQNAAMFPAATSSSSPISHPLRVKFPPFSPENIEMWFWSVEKWFMASNVEFDDHKFSAVLLALPQPTVTVFKDHLDHPPMYNKYEFAKELIIRHFSQNQFDRVKLLMENMELGDNKPSELYAQMSQIAGGVMSHEALKGLWIMRLPDQMRPSLALTSNQPMDFLRAADMIYEVTPKKPAFSLSEVVSPQVQDADADVASFSNKRKQHPPPVVSKPVTDKNICHFH